jgi:hypothetical protein
VPDLILGLRVFIETLSGEIIAVVSGLLLATAIAIVLAVGSRLYARMGK